MIGAGRCCGSSTDVSGCWGWHYIDKRGFRSDLGTWGVVDGSVWCTPINVIWVTLSLIRDKAGGSFWIRGCVCGSWIYLILGHNLNSIVLSRKQVREIYKQVIYESNWISFPMCLAVYHMGIRHVICFHGNKTGKNKRDMNRMNEAVHHNIDLGGHNFVPLMASYAPSNEMHKLPQSHENSRI